jgi:hypothetical protein
MSVHRVDRKRPDHGRRKNGIALQGCTAGHVIARIDEGVRVIAGHSEASAIKGRAHQKRMLPV